MSKEQEHPLDIARENDREVNDRLADTDGAICAMEYDGPLGYHLHVATGETDPEYLWKLALLRALNKTVFEMMYVDGDTPDEATEQLRDQLSEFLDPWQLDNVVESFDNELRDLIEAIGEISE